MYKVCMGLAWYRNKQRVAGRICQFSRCSSSYETGRGREQSSQIDQKNKKHQHVHENCTETEQSIAWEFFRRAPPTSSVHAHCHLLPGHRYPSAVPGSASASEELRGGVWGRRAQPSFWPHSWCSARGGQGPARHQWDDRHCWFGFGFRVRVWVRVRVRVSGLDFEFRVWGLGSG